MKHEFLAAAIEEALKGLSEGGIPIGAILVIDGKIVGRGHNRRVQQGSAVLHAEMDCLENAGRLTAKDYSRATLLYGIPRVVVGENRNFRGPEDYVRSRGVELEIVNDTECIRMMEEFIRAHPALWNEDIGE